MKNHTLEVTTRLTHAESGEWIQSTMHMPLGKRDPQGAGSATTYGLRYSLMAMLGLPPTDDDGEAAMDRGGDSRSQSVQQNGNVASIPANRPSSAQLKRDKVWEEMQNDMAGCNTVPALLEVRKHWGTKALRERWPQAWLDAAAEDFEKAEKALHQVELMRAG